MPTIIEFQTAVQDILTQYGDLFANEPERRHFASSLTGLYIAERKTVSGINCEFAATTDQSCLNRWMTEVRWDPKALNKRRLDTLQRESSTRYTKKGVIAIDNTLIAHDGKLIADVGWFWDHADQRHLIAHDYLIANCVCVSGKHYPIGESCRAMFRETLGKTIAWVVEQVARGQSLSQIKAQLALP